MFCVEASKRSHIWQQGVPCVEIITILLLFHQIHLTLAAGQASEPAALRYNGINQNENIKLNFLAIYLISGGTL